MSLKISISCFSFPPLRCTGDLILPSANSAATSSSNAINSPSVKTLLHYNVAIVSMPGYPITITTKEARPSFTANGLAYRGAHVRHEPLHFRQQMLPVPPSGPGHPLPLRD